MTASCRSRAPHDHFQAPLRSPQAEEQGLSGDTTPERPRTAALTGQPSRAEEGSLHREDARPEPEAQRLQLRLAIRPRTRLEHVLRLGTRGAAACRWRSSFPGRAGAWPSPSGLRLHDLHERMAEALGTEAQGTASSHAQVGLPRGRRAQERRGPLCGRSQSRHLRQRSAPAFGAAVPPVPRTACTRGSSCSPQTSAPGPRAPLRPQVPQERAGVSQEGSGARGRLQV